MKKVLLILVVGILLAGCAGLPSISLPRIIAASPTPPLPPETPVPAASETPIPTQNLFATSTSTPLTFTPTVTMIGAELFTPTGTATLFPTMPPPTVGVPVGPANLSLFTPVGVGFVRILTSSSLMYWNEGPCSPREIRMSAFVADPENTDQVLLFMRLREKKNTLHVTDWGSGAIMFKGEDGSFYYDIHTWNLNRYAYFHEGWIEYQLVAYDEDRQEIGRTPINDKNLTLVLCRPIK